MLISFYRECVKNNEHSETNGSVWKQLVSEKGQMRIPRLIHTVKGPVHTSTVAVFGPYNKVIFGVRCLDQNIFFCVFQKKENHTGFGKRLQHFLVLGDLSLSSVAIYRYIFSSHLQN